MIYWNFSVRLVASCKNMFCHLITCRTPYNVVMGHDCPDIHLVRPFCCRMLYYSVTVRITLFSLASTRRVYRTVTGGGIWKVHTGDLVKQIKYVRANEDEVPGITEIRLDNDVDSDSDQESCSRSSRRLCNPRPIPILKVTMTAKKTSDTHELITYIPTHSSTYGDSGHDSNEDEENHGKQDWWW